MHTQRVKLVLAAMVVCAVLLGGVSAASATTVRFNPGGAIALRGSVLVEYEGGSFSCTMSFTGSLTSTAVEAVPGANIGSINEATNECPEGRRIRILSRGPLRLVELLPGPGVLAYLEEIGLLFSQETPFPSRCLYGPRLGILINSEEITFLTEPPLRLLRQLEGSLFCPIIIRLRGRMAMTPRQEIIVR